LLIENYTRHDPVMSIWRLWRAYRLCARNRFFDVFLRIYYFWLAYTTA